MVFLWSPWWNSSGLKLLKAKLHETLKLRKTPFVFFFIDWMLCFSMKSCFVIALRLGDYFYFWLRRLCPSVPPFVVLIYIDSTEIQWNERTSWIESSSRFIYITKKARLIPQSVDRCRISTSVSDPEADAITDFIDNWFLCKNSILLRSEYFFLQMVPSQQTFEFKSLSR